MEIKIILADGYTMKDYKILAKELGLKNYSKLNKSDVSEIIEARIEAIIDEHLKLSKCTILR